MFRSENKIIFYTDQERSSFIQILGEELEKLENLNMKFVVFRDGNLLAPKMLFNNSMTIGLDNIKNEITSITSNRIL
jgi:hypothetical protein